MGIFDLMVYTLYQAYRKRKSSKSASWNSKGVISLAFWVYIFSVFLLMSNYSNAEFNYLPNNKLLVALMILVPSKLIIHLSTKSAKELEAIYESKDDLNINLEKGWTYFSTFFISGLLLFAFAIRLLDFPFLDFI